MLTCRVSTRFVREINSDLPALGPSVTPSPENGISCSLCFQSLAHSFAGVFLTTPLQSCCSALFDKNTGGGYTPRNSYHVFKRLRTLPPNGECEGVYPERCTRGASGLFHCFVASLRPYLSFVVASLESRCISTENVLYLFSVHVVTGLFPSQRGGVHPLPHILFRNGGPAPSFVTIGPRKKRRAGKRAWPLIL
jgi:hypothetical protein